MGVAFTNALGLVADKDNQMMELLRPSPEEAFVIQNQQVNASDKRGYPTWKPSISITFLLLLFSTLLFLTPTMAEITSVTITSDARPMILIGKFAFTFRGHASVSVSSVSVLSSSSQPESSRLGFFLVIDKALFHELDHSFCILDSNYIYRLFTFRDLSPPPSNSFNRSFPIFTSNEYSLFFANCARETSVSMFVRTELFNVDSDGSKDYLSLTKSQFPLLFFIFFLIYTVFIIVWVYTCYMNIPSVHQIHMVMGLLLLMKDLDLIFRAVDNHYVKVTGVSHGWDTWYYIFHFTHVILLFTVIVLIGAGWSLLKPFLQNREKNVLFTIILFQIFTAVFSVVVDDEPNIKQWSILLGIDVTCWYVILPINWSIELLVEKASRNLSKLTAFKRFRLAVLIYMGFTRFVPFILKIITSCEYRWISNGAEEMGCLVFFIFIFYMFRPVEEEAVERGPELELEEARSMAFDEE